MLSVYCVCAVCMNAHTYCMAGYSIRKCVIRTIQDVCVQCYNEFIDDVNRPCHFLLKGCIHISVPVWTCMCVHT